MFACTRHWRVEACAGVLPHLTVFCAERRCAAQSDARARVMSAAVSLSIFICRGLPAGEEGDCNMPLQDRGTGGRELAQPRAPREATDAPCRPDTPWCAA